MEEKRKLKILLKYNKKHFKKKSKKDIKNKKNLQFYTVERIEESIVVLENRDTLEMTEVNIKEFLEKINEGDIVKKINGRYLIDKDETLETKKRIEEKMNDIWN